MRLRLDVPRFFPRPELDASCPQNLVRNLLKFEQLPQLFGKWKHALRFVKCTLALEEAIQ